MALFPYVVIAKCIAAENADAVDADMGLQSTDAIKFCFRKHFHTDARAPNRVERAL
jgi:hypothetical protein